jgi:hypothetical protein
MILVKTSTGESFELLSDSIRLKENQGIDGVLEGILTREGGIEANISGYHIELPLELNDKFQSLLGLMIHVVLIQGKYYVSKMKFVEES